MDDADPDVLLTEDEPAAPVSACAEGTALLASPARFINRELSWLAVNERVLRSEARRGG